jgi:formate hydrogenlyase subunit 3/multisubunit Na+/H+ antiporter MnhD subunit
MRPVGLTILALGMASARQRARTIEFSDLVGLAWNSPWTAAALIVGSFSLAGLPPLPGFLPRWVEVRLLAESHNVTAALIVLAVTLAAALATLRGLDFILSRPRDLFPDDPRRRPEPRWTAILVTGGLLTALIVVLFPGLLDTTLRAAVASYTFLGQ